MKVVPYQIVIKFLCDVFLSRMYLTVFFLDKYECRVKKYER